MTIELVLAITLTIGISALCSTLEAMILSITVAEIESLKEKSPKNGKLLEKFKVELEETSSAILSLNTIANTLGATLVGGLAEKTFSGHENSLLIFAIGMTLGILFFSEILPKNLAVSYRFEMASKLIIPLALVRWTMSPISKICKVTVRAIVPPKDKESESDEQEIILLAQKGAKEGTLTSEESDLVTNALHLNNLKVEEIMTPRTVMFVLDESSTVEKVFEDHPNIPFARIPITHESIDHISGIVRRRDLHSALVDGSGKTLIKELAHEVTFVPENATADKALRLLLNEHCQLTVVVDEYGSVAGVLALEDIIESILGQEIFEPDDIAVDMRELAKRRNKSKRVDKES